MLCSVRDEEVGNHHPAPWAPKGLWAAFGQHVLPRWAICGHSLAAGSVRICLLDGVRQNGATGSRDCCHLVFSQPFPLCEQTSLLPLAHQVEACLDAELSPAAALMNFPPFFLSFQDV